MKFNKTYLNKAGALRPLALVFLVCLNLACASYQGKVDQARKLLRTSPVQAAEQLKPLASTPNDDQLVYLLDYGTALQQAGQYEESNKVFMLADKLAEVKDYTSISRQAGSLLLNEGMVQYQGDDYEKVLINAMLAYNFLMLDNLDGALVETRRLNEKLTHYRVDAKKDYEQNVFAIYLSALIWESDRKWDDAYIAFKKAYDLDPTIPYLKRDLVRSAYNSRRMEDFSKWKKQFNIDLKPEDTNKNMGELVLIYQQGWGPRKFPHPESRRIPKLYPIGSYTNAAKLVVKGGIEAKTEKIYSVQEVAMKTLNDAYAKLIAKRVAGAVVKEVVADQVRQQNELLGNLLQLGLHISDQADLRQWSTLPETFQIAKIRLKPGTYEVTAWGLADDGEPTGEQREPSEVKIKAGRKTFIGWRTYR